MIPSRCLTGTMRLHLALACLALASATAWSAPRARIPVVIATDIGDDIDDTWALAQALRSPELDVKMVLTELGAPRYRGALAAKFLEVTGHTGVDVALGKDLGPSDDEKRNQFPWMHDYDLSRYPGRVHEDGVGAFLELVRRSESSITVIAIGPTPSLAEAVRREPRFAERCRFTGMYGSFDVGYDNTPGAAAEWNVRGDVAALRTVLAAPWQDILITPLDTCGRVSLVDDNYRRIWQAAPTDPMVRAVIENYCLWAPRVPWMKCDFFVARSTTLFDDVAVTLAHDESCVSIESLRFEITDEGKTVRASEGPFRARVALHWTDRPAFERSVAERILGNAR